MSRRDPKTGNHREEKEQLLDAPAKVTVIRRESSGLNSFEVWNFFLNGDNIGKIEDGAQAAAPAVRRVNVLEAKGPKGAVSELKFSVKSGAEAEVVFKAGKFASSQGISIVIPAGNAGVFDKIAEGFNSKKLWAYWAVLIGCYAAVFALSRALGFAPTFVLAALPFIVILLTRQAVRRAMGGYLYYDQPEAWGRTAHEMVNTSMWRSYKEIRSLYYDQELERAGIHRAQRPIRHDHSRFYFLRDCLFCGDHLFRYYNERQLTQQAWKNR